MFLFETKLLKLGTHDPLYLFYLLLKSETPIMFKSGIECIEQPNPLQASYQKFASWRAGMLTEHPFASCMTKWIWIFYLKKDKEMCGIEQLQHGNSSQELDGNKDTQGI